MVEPANQLPSKNPTVVKGKGPIGATLTDPLGATFAQVYHTPGYFYVLWNDQFYGNPIDTMGPPHGHSKGMAAWNQDGEGFVLQVSTPSWPASGCYNISRNSQKTIDAVRNKVKVKNKLVELDFNTLGCIDDDDVEVAQHFFALKLTKNSLVTVLEGLANASVVTDPKQPALCNNGGPLDIVKLVNQLGKPSTSKNVLMTSLSTDVQLISKPSSLAVPPWQLVSAKLDGLSLRVVSWWDKPCIYSSKAGETPGCWATGLGVPGDVDIALTGSWAGVQIDLIGANGKNSNHAKIGISKDASKPLSSFGDENQAGALRVGYDEPGQKCSSAQNGRGGTFYVVNNKDLFNSLTKLFSGRTAGISADHTDLSGIEKSKPASNATKKTATKPRSKAAAKPAIKEKARSKTAATKKAAKPASKK